MLLKNVAGQGVYLYAWNTALNTPDTGDSANITGSYTLDGTDHSGFSTAHPTEIAVGIYWQPLAQAETNGNMNSYRWASTTSGVQIQPVFVATSGVNLPVATPGAAGGLVVAGSNAATTFASFTVTAGLTIATYTGDTPQTGDSFARLGAPSGASIDADILSRLATSGYTTPPTAAAVAAAILTQPLNAARAMDTIADTSRTVNDAMHGAIDAVSAQIDASSGTTCVYKTASTGTVLRTKTLTQISPPSTVPDKAV
jgi:hypothetical protein